MKIIALHNGHDASITSFEDGKILYHHELERVLNKKHFCGIDNGNEIADVLYNHVLPILGWKSSDIDIIGFAGHSEWRKTEFHGNVPTYKPLEYTKPYAEGHIKLRGSNREIPCYSVIHHVNHAAYTYYTSPFNHALIYTHDGLGDLVSGIVAVGKGNTLTVRGEITLNPVYNLEPNAIGLTYSYLGRVFKFLRKRDGSEDLLGTAGKFMGLSSYGKPVNEWRKECRKLLTTWMPDPANLLTKLNIQNWSDDPMNPVVQNLAATIQDEAELLVCDSIKKIQSAEKILYGDNEYLNNLCICGGVGLNVQINSRLLNDKVVKNLWIPPACSDVGNSIGTCLFIWWNIINEETEIRG